MRLTPAQPIAAIASTGASGFVLIVAIALIGLLGAARQAGAEPIALDSVDAEQRAAAADNEASGELADVLRSTLSAGADPADTSASASTSRPTPAPSARPSAPPGLSPPVRDALRPNAARRPATPMTASGEEMSDEEPDWERELKETLRPVYDELAASGIVDAVQGFKTYLAMLGAITSSERGTAAGQRATADGHAQARTGAAEATWETRTAPADAHANAPSEKERLIAAVILEEWLGAALPWLYAFAALFIAWQIARLVFAFLRSRTKRAQRRAARNSHRSASAARTRARS